MKQNGNKYRKREESTVKQLENKLSLWNRLFSIITFLRSAKRLRKWLIIASCVVLLVVFVHVIISWASKSDDSTNVWHISYNSQTSIIEQEQIITFLSINEETDIASLPKDDLQAKLNNNPAIKEATITRTASNNLQIDVTERIPLLYVEMTDSAVTGKTSKFYLSPDGEIFPPDPRYHAQFVELPTWRLNPGDVATFAPGNTINAELCKPVIELAKEANKYSDLTQLPRIISIERPPQNSSQWRMLLHLESGETVEMSTLKDISEQVEKLVKVLEHARCINKKIIYTSVVPEENIPAVFAE